MPPDNYKIIVKINEFDEVLSVSEKSGIRILKSSEGAICQGKKNEPIH